MTTKGRVADALVSPPSRGPALDELWPPRGPCDFCGGPDARHRTWDAIASRHAAGETIADIADDFALTEAHIEAAIARGES